MCQTRILTQIGATTISFCAGCQAIYIWHRNLLVSFSEPDFNSFKRMIASLEFEECAFNFPDSISRIIIKTPNHDISFTFTEPEWDDLNQALYEANFMKEVYQLI